MEGGIFTYLILIGVFIFGLYVLYSFVPFGIWVKAQISGVRISLLELINMKICRIAPSPIVRSMIMAARAHIEIHKDALEAHSKAGGDVEKVVREMIRARNNREHLSFKQACKLDLAIKDPTDESKYRPSNFNN
jgi:uncharacterized protein YqfA (UPF0365 family)